MTTDSRAKGVCTNTRTCIGSNSVSANDRFPYTASEMLLMLAEFACGLRKVNFFDGQPSETTLSYAMEQVRLNGTQKYKISRICDGTYGIIYRLRSPSAQVLVLKVTQYDGSTNSGSFVESFLLRYLFRQFALTGITPHLPITLCSARSSGREEIITISEHASYGSLCVILPRLAVAAAVLDNAVRTILFQITYTFAWIQHVHPSFRHNDTSSGNVLVGKAPDEGYSRYLAPDGSVFQVPNTGIRAILWDFDMASIVGLADNNRVYRFEVENTDYGIGTAVEAGYDMYCLARWIYSVLECQRAFLESSILADMIAVWGKDELTRKKEPTVPAMRMLPFAHLLPTPLELLSTRLFSKFQLGGEPVPTEYVFGSKHTQSSFLNTDEIVEMLHIEPSDLSDDYSHSVPIAFGAPQQVRDKFLVLPSAQAYHRLQSAYESDSAVQPLSVPTDSNDWQEELASHEVFLADVLEYMDFPEEQRSQKLFDVLHEFARVMEFLQTIEQRYVKLVALLILFSEGDPIATDDFICDIGCYSGDRYETNDIYAGFMQYKWLKLIFGKHG